jgi:SHS2 domain-containing protein
MAASSRTLQHVGEWKVELRADTVESLFAELARVLAESAGPAGSPLGSGAWERVELEARDHATLLVDWANELIGRSEVAGRVYESVRNLSIDSSSTVPVRLAADVRGDRVGERVSPVKAATYHQASVERKGSEWRGVVLLDV